MDEDVIEFISQYPPMKEARDTGKDIYATYASLIFSRDYEDCCPYIMSDDGEHMVCEYEKPNIYGKTRRDIAKRIVLVAFMIQKGYSVEDALSIMEGTIELPFKGDKDESNS